ncbi:MAG: DUF5132 domain-containing protein [Desulfobacterota bacterium]|jgi:hypothetical protein|nr:DUF5132 domain-containing protein [Thermodesulfobacteriota bacterium]
MGFFDNGLKGNIVTGLAIGIGSSILAPVVIPVLASVVKPMAKAAIKGGVLVYQKGREMAAEAQEVVEDLVAEVKAELDETGAGAAAGSIAAVAAEKKE